MPKAASTLAAAPSTPQARVSKTSVTVKHVRPVSKVILNPRNGFRQREPKVDKVPDKECDVEMTVAAHNRKATASRAKGVPGASASTHCVQHFYVIWSSRESVGRHRGGSSP